MYVMRSFSFFPSGSFPLFLSSLFLRALLLFSYFSVGRILSGMCVCVAQKSHISQLPEKHYLVVTLFLRFCLPKEGDSFFRKILQVCSEPSDGTGRFEGMSLV